MPASEAAPGGFQSSFSKPYSNNVSSMPTGLPEIEVSDERTLCASTDPGHRLSLLPFLVARMIFFRPRPAHRGRRKISLHTRVFHVVAPTCDAFKRSHTAARVPPSGHAYYAPCLDASSRTMLVASTWDRTPSLFHTIWHLGYSGIQDTVDEYNHGELHKENP